MDQNETNERHRIYPSKRTMYCPTRNVRMLYDSDSLCCPVCQIAWGNLLVSFHEDPEEGVAKHVIDHIRRVSFCPRTKKEYAFYADTSLCTGCGTSWATLSLESDPPEDFMLANMPVNDENERHRVYPIEKHPGRMSYCPRTKKEYVFYTDTSLCAGCGVSWDVLSLESDPTEDPVNHPPHYNAYKGLEVIDLVEQMNFCRGNAVKYIARAGLKSKGTEIQDLEKAAWYIQREIARLKKEFEGNDGSKKQKSS